MWFGLWSEAVPDIASRNSAIKHLLLQRSLLRKFYPKPLEILGSSSTSVRAGLGAVCSHDSALWLSTARRVLSQEGCRPGLDLQEGPTRKADGKEMKQFG